MSDWSDESEKAQTAKLLLELAQAHERLAMLESAGMTALRRAEKAEARVKELEELPADAGGALGRAILMFREAEAALEQEVKKQHAITKHAYDDVSQTLKEAEAENAALRAERNELLHQQQNGYPSVEEVGIEGLRQRIKGLEAERDRLRESRDGMLREAVRALEHWLAKGAKVVWTPYLTPSACRELLRAAGFYGADQLEHARAALASVEESRETAGAVRRCG